ncbi:MAG: hypothetical protein GX969_08920, partial [Firmicutes bacterium]|nr:hypothetical protein [Bacillota bacterium]
MRLKRATYRHIEAEIYAYHETKKALRELRLEILHAGGDRSPGVASGEGYSATSMTERRATKLADSVLLREMERVTEAIASTYEQTKDEGRRVVYVKYGLAIGWEPPAELAVRMERRKMRGDISHRGRKGNFLPGEKEESWKTAIREKEAAKQK